MAFTFQRKSTAKPATTGRPAAGLRVYSVAALLKARDFAGQFEAGGDHYTLNYTPSRAEAVNTRLQLTGRLTISNSSGRTYSQDGVRATLAAIQGGIGNPPPRRPIQSAGTTEARPPRAAEQRSTDSGQRVEDRNSNRTLPEVEATGPLSFCGVMYLKLDPLDGRNLGVRADLSNVQMNVRFAPVTDKEREIHGVYSSLIDTLISSPSDGRAAALLEALNDLLL